MSEFLKLFRETPDFDLLRQTDPGFAESLGKEDFSRIKTVVLHAEKTTVDIGAGSNPLKGLIFFDAIKTICIDPAYAWYEQKAGSDIFKSIIPPDIFGGIGYKHEITENVRKAFKNLQVPRKIEGPEQKIIQGNRFGRERIIELIPAGAAGWLSEQKPDSIPNLVMWRVFTSAQNWGKLISSLKTGGYLITTGIGRSAFGELLDDENQNRFSGGVDVSDTPLPRNGKSESIGLLPIPFRNPIQYFYQKIRDYPPDYVAQQIREHS